MQGEIHLSAELLTVVDALRSTLDLAQRQLEHAQHIQRAITGMAGLTLRQQGLSDSFIQHLLGLDDDLLTVAMREAGPVIEGMGDWQLHAELEQLWTTVRRRASVWFQTDDVETSSEVIRHNVIDTGSWPLSIEELDTLGAEFVHQISGQKIVVYSLQGRNGTPTIVDGRIRSWDDTGSYKVEFISPGIGPTRLDLVSFGLAYGAHTFHGRRGDGPDGAFGLVVAAIRRTCGPLPPYAEAARLSVTDPSLQ
jgi:hypothetical protein